MKAKKEIKKVFGKYQEGGKTGSEKPYSQRTPAENAKSGRERVEKYKKEGAKVVNKWAYENLDTDTINKTYLEGVKNQYGKVVPGVRAVGITEEYYKKAKGGKVEAKMAKGGKVTSKKKK